MKNPPINVFLVVACALVIVGCGTSLSTKSSSETIVHGMPYYLPIAKMTIKGEFTKASTTTLNSNGANNLNLTWIERAVSLAEVEEAKASPSPSPSDSAKPNSTTKPAASDSSSTGAVVITGGELTITMTAEVEADSSAPCYAVPARNYVFDDETRITVNSKHLLSVGNATAQDRTADIVASVASMTKAALGPFLRTLPQAVEPNKQPFYYSFHPSKQGEVADVKTHLGSRNIEFDCVPSRPIHFKGLADGDATSPQRGLVFRQAIPYNIHIKYVEPDSNNKKWAVIDYDQQFVLPDTKTAFVLDYARAPFVKKITEVGFTDGMLTDFHETFPSPIMGFLGIPKAILDAIVPLPSSTKTGGTGTKSGS